jgi:trimeric autotransporter adhesin
MADQKISAMPSAATLDGTEITPIVQTGTNKQVTTADYVSQVLDINPVLTTQGGTDITSYTLGDTLYSSATDTLAKLAGNTTTTQKFLSQTGTGSVSAAPIWKALSPADINTQYGAFYFDYSTTVSSLVGLNDTTINVVSTSGFSTAGALIIGAELVTYTGKTATSFTGCTRGAAGSSNKSHAVGVAVNGAQVATANTSTLLQLNTTTASNGVTLNTSTQEISVAIGGIYNFAFSAQLNNSTAGQTLLVVWFAVDGTDVPASASWATIASRENDTTPAAALMAANVFLQLTSSNKVTMKWLSVDGHGSLVTYPASVSPAYPAAPAVILTVNQVS